jgi:hypothetical protein
MPRARRVSTVLQFSPPGCASNLALRLDHAQRLFLLLARMAHGISAHTYAGLGCIGGQLDTVDGKILHPMRPWRSHSPRIWAKSLVTSSSSLETKAANVL